MEAWGSVVNSVRGVGELYARILLTGTSERGNLSRIQERRRAERVLFRTRRDRGGCDGFATEQARRL